MHTQVTSGRTACRFNVIIEIKTVLSEQFKLDRKLLITNSEYRKPRKKQEGKRIVHTLFLPVKSQKTGTENQK